MDDRAGQRDGADKAGRPDLGGLGSLRTLFLIAGAGGSAFIPFFALLLAGRGLTPQSIGLVFAVTSLVGAVTAPLWSHLADTRLGAARVLIVSSAATALFALALAVSGSAFWAILLVAVLMSMCSSPGAPLSDALAVAYLGEERMSEYGRIRLWASLGWGVAVIGFGALYEAVGVASGPAPVRGRHGRLRPVDAASAARRATAGARRVAVRCAGRRVPCFARLGVVRDRHGDRERGDLRGAGLREPAHRRHRRRSVPRRPGGRPRRPDRDPGDALERRPRPALRPALGVRRGGAGLRSRVSVLEFHGLAAGAGAGGHRRRRGLRPQLRRRRGDRRSAGAAAPAVDRPGRDPDLRLEHRRDRRAVGRRVRLRPPRRAGAVRRRRRRSAWAAPCGCGSRSPAPSRLEER